MNNLKLSSFLELFDVVLLDYKQEPESASETNKISSFFQLVKEVLICYNQESELAKKTNKLSSFLQLLKSPLKILSQNGNLMAITSTIYIIIYFILCTYSANPFIVDLVLKLFALVSARPGTPEYTELLVTIREDLRIFPKIEAAYAVFYFFAIVFAQTIVIVIASSYCTGNNLSIKMVSRTWTRPFVTSFYVQLLGLGYTSFFLFPFLLPSHLLYNHDQIILISLAILFIIFNLYQSVVWSLAIVVSVLEDTYGLSALEKARELVKGKRIYGCLLNFFFSLVVLAILMVGFKVSHMMPMVVGPIQVVLIGMASMFQFMSFSVFYAQCKNEMNKSGVTCKLSWVIRKLRNGETLNGKVIDRDAISKEVIFSFNWVKTILGQLTSTQSFPFFSTPSFLLPRN